jgi:phosphopantothenoylcysteine decarboxylase / phosphopantothenate---cysteine ligase
MKVKTVLITAGPTREALDPVRYISNHSTGKMGYAIARQFLETGYQVILISGPVYVKIEAHPRLTVINVESAMQMLAACQKYFASVDICVFAAAVADYRPGEVSNEK